MSGMQSYTFYATFGSGQSGYPGYLKCEVEAASKEYARALARSRVHDATEGHWCMLYESLDELDERDRVYRGKV